jgi:signal transduction histidine kinase
VAGSGIGLYVARKIVEVHRGALTVRSKENEGSTFTVSLPLAAT